MNHTNNCKKLFENEILHKSQEDFCIWSWLEKEVKKKNQSRCRRHRRLKGIHSRPDTNRTGAKGLSFYYPRLLHCLDQMLTVMSLSQHRVSSSKTVRPRAPCGARCIGHTVSTWSAVCSEAPHSQFGECIGHTVSIWSAVCSEAPHSQFGCQVWQDCPRDSAHLAQTGIWILVSFGQYLRTHLKDHAKYDRSPEIHSKPKRVSLPFGKAQLAGCLKVQVGGPLEWDAGIQ